MSRSKRRKMIELTPLEFDDSAQIVPLGNGAQAVVLEVNGVVYKCFLMEGNPLDAIEETEGGYHCRGWAREALVAQHLPKHPNLLRPLECFSGDERWIDYLRYMMKESRIAIPDTDELSAVMMRMDKIDSTLSACSHPHSSFPPAQKGHCIDFAPFILQTMVLIAIYTAAGIVHQDLHLANLFLKYLRKSKPPLKLEVCDDNFITSTYLIGNQGYQVVIGDWGLARKTNAPIVKGPTSSVEYDPFYDALKVLSSCWRLREDIGRVFAIADIVDVLYEVIQGFIKVVKYPISSHYSKAQSWEQRYLCVQRFFEGVPQRSDFGALDHINPFFMPVIREKNSHIKLYFQPREYLSYCREKLNPDDRAMNRWIRKVRLFSNFLSK